MKKFTFGKVLLLCALGALSLLAFAKQEKVIRVFSNGEVINEYNASDIDYIQVDDLIESPSNLIASVADNAITITWNEVSGATYSVFRSSDNVHFVKIATGLKVTSYTDNAPLQGTNFYRVSAIIDGEESVKTNSVAATLPGNGMESGIYLGLFGFNQAVYEYPVKLLDKSSISGFNTFIDELAMKNGTLLYYSVDQALNAMQTTEYPSDLSNVALVTFTDGLDQGSMMKAEGYEDDAEYLNALNNRIKTQTVSGKPISAFSIGVRGSDVVDINKFRENLQKLASSPENATEVTSMSEVTARFQEIAEQLSKSSYVQTINLKMPGIANGTLVRFTFDNVSSAKNSSLYIEGTFNLNTKSLENIVYNGLTSTSGTTVKGTVEDIFVSFTFEGVQNNKNELIKSEYTAEWTYVASNSTWQINSEFDKSENSEIQTERSSAAIMLVVDCSSSLGTQFATAQSNAKGFIKTLYDVTGAEPIKPEPPVEIEINGIIASTAENPVYYTITNMRANRMSFVKADHGDGDVAGGQIMSESNGEGWVVRTDTSGVGWLPEFHNEEPTPEIWSFPYMGLAEVEGKFWTAFSAMPEVMDPRTIYWWFEYTGTGKSVYIHNAVIDGTLKNRTEFCAGRPSMSFSGVDKDKYYLIPLTKDQLDDLFPDGDEFAENSFAISRNSAIANPKTGAVVNANSCLDMNNYITYNYAVPTDDVEEVPVMEQYGFAGVNLSWNPLNESGGNRSDNNGSLFKIERVTDEELSKVQSAVEDYQNIIAEACQEQVVHFLEREKEKTIERIDCFHNFPEFYDADKVAKLDAIIADINNTAVNIYAVKSQADVDVMEAEITDKMEQFYCKALALAGDGTIITLQQMLAIRDFTSVEDGEGNFYLSADGYGEVKYDRSLEYIGYDAVICVKDDDESCKWTMEWVPGKGYKLRNGDKYIRQFGNWVDIENKIMEGLGLSPYDFEEGETLWDHIDTNVMTWALTKDADLAAIFTFTCNDTAVQEVNLSDSHQELVDLYAEELGYNSYDPTAENYIKNTTNIIHLQSTDPEGNTTYLCRDSAVWNYIVDSWYAGTRYFATSNCWKVKVVQRGNEIVNAPKKAQKSVRNKKK